MTHMLTSALLWLEKDFAVFPLMPRGKIPLGSLAPHGFKDATRDHAIIREWWRRSPEANIGIATGSGHFVLDLDDADAAAWFGNACERHGGAPSLTVRTARGFHVFFASDAPVPNSAGRLVHGVDVRGDGGYVVAAPSVHPTGRVYTIVRDLPIAEAPRWLVDLAMPEEPPQPPPRLPERFRRPNLSACRREDARLRAIPGILSLLANAREGERNRITFWAACRFSEMVRDGLLTQSLAEDLLRQGASRCGLNGREILSTRRSAFKQGVR